MRQRALTNACQQTRKRETMQIEISGKLSQDWLVSAAEWPVIVLL